MPDNRNQLKNSEQEDGISKMLGKYLPHWPIFLVLFVISVAGSLVYLRYATKIYDTSAVILIKDEKKGVDDSNLMEQLDMFGSKKLVENELEVIQSRTLFRNIVKNLSLYAPVNREGRIKSGSAYISSPVNIQVKNPDVLVPVKKRYFTYDSANSAVIMGGKTYPVGVWFNDSVNEMRFVKNERYRRPDNPKPLFFALIDVKEIIDNLLDHVKAMQATKLSSVINLKLKDPVPERGVDILNDLISEYNKAAISDKNELAVNTLKFVKERLAIVSKELDSIEKGIQVFKTKEGIVDISAQGEQYLEGITANEQKLSEINVQLSVMDQVEKYIKTNNTQLSIVPSMFGINDPSLNEMLGKFYDLEVQFEGLQKTTAENNPILITLKNEISRIKPAILDNVGTLRHNLEAAKANLSGTADKYSNVLKSIPLKERKLVEISREQVIQNTLYSFLLQKREETALTYNSTIADTRVVDQAETDFKPSSPKRLVTILLAVMGSFALGMVYVRGREILNPNIANRGELEEYTRLPIIGEIMNDNSKIALIKADNKRSVIAEQFRHLRTTLAYIGINNRKKKLLVTSSISGEGKTFISANLGVSLSLTNKKVVLIELDLRKPKLSKMFDLPGGLGLTNYLIGTCEAEEIIRNTGVNKNLFIISAGAIPPNPSELILNGKIEELLSYLETAFDYIIVDTCPINPVTDAYILSPFCDATLFVTREAVTPRQLIKSLDANLMVRGLKNLTLVYNGVKRNTFGPYRYGSSSYTNGYFEEDKESKKSGNGKKGIFKKKDKNISQ